MFLQNAGPPPHRMGSLYVLLSSCLLNIPTLGKSSRQGREVLHILNHAAQVTEYEDIPKNHRCWNPWHFWLEPNA